MHKCDCCSTCQYELNTLRTKYQSILPDYQKLKSKIKLANHTQQLYKDQNVQLNQTSIDQQAKIILLEEELKDYHEYLNQHLYEKLGNEEQRRKENRVDELNRNISSKNSNIKTMKEDLERRIEEVTLLRNQNEILRKKISELTIYITNRNLSQINLEKRTNIQKDKYIQYIKTLEETQQSRFSHTKIQQNHKVQSLHFRKNRFGAPSTPNNKCCIRRNNQQFLSTNFRPSLIQSRIKQLERENSRMRQKLFTKI